MQTTLEPTKEAQVNTFADFTFSCEVTLAETQRIIITLNISETLWDSGLGQYVTTIEPKKFQLEKLSYYVNGNNQCSFRGGTLRGFRKDGALKYRESYIPTSNISEALQQIPTHYHDYAIKEFNEKMLELSKDISLTIQNGVKLK